MLFGSQEWLKWSETKILIDDKHATRCTCWADVGLGIMRAPGTKGSWRGLIYGQG